MVLKIDNETITNNTTNATDNNTISLFIAVPSLSFFYNYIYISLNKYNNYQSILCLKYNNEFYYYLLHISLIFKY